MKILLFGASGCFGTELISSCNKKNISLIHQPSSKLNILNYDELEKKITIEKPDVVVNSTAIVGINQCEENYNKAFALNSVGPLNLAKICSKLDITLIFLTLFSYFVSKSWTACLT